MENSWGFIMHSNTMRELKSGISHRNKNAGARFIENPAALAGIASHSPANSLPYKVVAELLKYYKQALQVHFSSISHLTASVSQSAVPPTQYHCINPILILRKTELLSHPNNVLQHRRFPLGSVL